MWESLKKLQIFVTENMRTIIYNLNSLYKSAFVTLSNS